MSISSIVFEEWRGVGGRLSQPNLTRVKVRWQQHFECREIMCVEWKKIFRSNLLPSFDQTLANNSD